jgi:hypothetical protein
MPVQLLLNLVDFLKCPTLSEKHSRRSTSKGNSSCFSAT